MGYINTQQIPKSEGNVMAALLLSTITEYFDDPKNQKEFENWQQSRYEKRTKK